MFDLSELDPPSRIQLQAAVHEAGHVIVMEEVGIEYRHIVMSDLEGAYVEAHKNTDDERELMASLGGVIAERALFSKAPLADAFLHASSDFADIRKLLGKRRWDSATTERAFHRATKVVLTNLVHIWVIAAELLKRGRLTPFDVKVIRATYPAEDVGAASFSFGE